MIPQIWHRKQTGSYYVQINDQQIRLGRTKAEAIRKYKRLLRERGLSNHSRKFTIHQLIDAYWDWYAAHRAKTTVETRRGILQSFRDFISRGLPAEQVKPFQVDRWLAASQAKSPSTLNSRIALLSGMFNWGVRMGHVETNPLARMPKPTPRIREEFVPPSKFRKLIAAARSRELRDVIRFMLDSGARAQEVFRFEAKHFDGQRLVLPIVDSKGKKTQRVIYLTDTTRPIINRLVRKHPTGLLFRNSRGTPWNKDNINCAMRRLRKEVGLPRLCATMLRHSFAHYRLSKGQDAAIVAKLMGHVDTRQLLTRYGHLQDATERLASEANAVRLPGLGMLPT